MPSTPDAAQVTSTRMGRSWPYCRTTQAILTDLKCGKHLCVNGHEIYPDGKCVFFENTYNVTGVFGDLRDLTIADVEEFLTDMVKGEEWGLVPY
jgi:hypothetical protein